MESIKLHIANKKIEIYQIIVFFYSLIVMTNIFIRSMFNFGSTLIQLRYVLVIGIFILSLLFEQCTTREYIWLIIGVVCSICTFQKENVLLILILFSLRNVPVKKLLTAIVFSIIISLCIIILATKLNIIPNLIFYRDNLQRYSLGTQYPLIFSSYVFSMSAAILLVNKHRFNGRLIIVYGVIILLLEHFTHSRNDEFCIFLLILVICQQRLSINIKKCIVRILYVLTLSLILFSIFISNIFSYTSDMYIFLNNLFNQRLGQQYILFRNYSPKLLGQYIPQQGSGGMAQNINNYFYIDNSFVRLLFMSGILFSFFIMCTIFVQLFKLIQNDLFTISLVLMIILINGVFADSFSSFTLNLLMPLFYISLYQIKQLNSDVINT
ncbi:hypothetical protein [Lactobacillus amylovorus]|uniref:hypothetical protein n=1 Tax=Lactobacillus amylovorus TaxID=1604 RepID=UPI00232DDBAF|nr:hypothetical protein [Lactobacillus amylovorus]MDB6264720.1 hypothetical protein [Lactobacillus amylovorus]